MVSASFKKVLAGFYQGVSYNACIKIFNACIIIYTITHYTHYITLKIYQYRISMYVTLKPESSQKGIRTYGGFS